MRRKIYISALAVLFYTQVIGQYAWFPVGSGANLGVQALASDTNANILYLGGVFTSIGTTPALGIAQWDGANYAPVGAGILSGAGVSALFVESNGDVIAGGTFTNIGGILTNNIARWNGASWSALGPGLDVTVGIAVVKTVARFQGDLYAGGTFTQSGTSPVNYIARWDGSAWQPVAGGTNGTVNALCVYNNELYVGGTFTDAGGVTVNNIAKWDGTTWSDVGGGVNYTGAISVSALQVYSGDLYAGGTFTTAGTTPVNHIARWDGNAWSDVGGGANYTGAISVSALEVFNGDLTVGGSFDSLGTITANYVGKWNGISWSPMGLGMNAAVNSLEALRDTLYAGGNFTTADGNLALFVAQWKPSAATLSGAGVYTTASLVLFPNPAQNRIWISDRLKRSDLLFTLYDASGRKILAADRAGHEIDLSGEHIEPGLYIYKISSLSSGTLQQGKLVVER